MENIINEKNTSHPAFYQRNEAIDILRALTVLLMIFVNDFWSVKGVPSWMQHAERGVDFLGLADVVYPVFLFVVGMSIPFAIENRIRKGLPDVGTVLHIFSRTFALLIMGAFTEQSLARLSPDIAFKMPVFKMLMVAGFFMIWNIYPKTDKPIRHLYTALQIIGVLLLIYLACTFRTQDGGYFRGSYGILGSIGWAYMFCAFVYLFVRSSIPKILLFWLGLIIYCMARSKELIPKEPNILNDLMGIARIGSTTVLTMGGVLFSLMIVKYSHLEARKKFIYLVSLAAIVAFAAFFSHKFWIISKLSATPPWVLYSSAITIATYGLLHWIVSKGGAKWFNIIKAGGTATLSCYVMPYFLQSIFYSYLPVTLPEWMKTDIYGLIKCALWALLCILFTALLERGKIKLKI
jgi:predicted acyltransferase